MSAAVMPMRKVPCERAGAAERARMPRLAVSVLRRFRMRFSLFARAACKGQAKARDAHAFVSGPALASHGWSRVEENPACAFLWSQRLPRRWPFWRAPPDRLLLNRR